MHLFCLSNIQEYSRVLFLISTAKNFNYIHILMFWKTVSLFTGKATAPGKPLKKKVRLQFAAVHDDKILFRCNNHKS